jgi:hypothetical protein
MVEEIIKLLKTRRPNASEDWHEKLPHMARYTYTYYTILYILYYTIYTILYYIYYTY